MLSGKLHKLGAVNALPGLLQPGVVRRTATPMTVTITLSVVAEVRGDLTAEAGAENGEWRCGEKTGTPTE